MAEIAKRVMRTSKDKMMETIYFAMAEEIALSHRIHEISAYVNAKCKRNARLLDMFNRLMEEFFDSRFSRWGKRDKHFDNMVLKKAKLMRHSFESQAQMIGAFGLEIAKILQMLDVTTMAGALSVVTTDPPPPKMRGLLRDRHVAVIRRYFRLDRADRAVSMPPHQERVVAERAELEKKAASLSEFIGNNPIFETLDPAEQERLKEQNDVMWRYYEILVARIAAFPANNKEG